MDALSLVLLAIAVSIDGFWGGFAFGLRKIKISAFSLLIISSWSIICTMIAMIIGHNIKSFIPLEWAKYIGAGLLLILGIFTLKEGYKQKKDKTESVKNDNVYKFNFSDLFKILRNPILADMDHQNDIKPSEGTAFGLAVAMDASIAAFTISLMGFNPYLTPFLFGVTHFVLIGFGNILARLKILSFFGQKYKLLPGLILIGLALLRLV
jgi:putative sporulation protein YtaF